MGLSTDGHQAYTAPVGVVFRREIDWARIPRRTSLHARATRYSPAICTGVKIKPLIGNPDPARISTSYVERQNLTMRMGMRRSRD